MVHLRINEREPNPNSLVNFITVLPAANSIVEETARQVLRALAAQVKPIMKTHGFVVNSLEEYEYNTVFAGRNWNHGETIELVLRSSTGSLLSTHWLLSTLCHELAHIKHMNHGPAFQNLWHQLQQEVRVLQAKGYYGDGYWSSGNRLADSAKIAGEGIEKGELPEYMCGGAHSRARPVSCRPRKLKGSQIPKKRKAGTRVNSSAFNSIGKPLNENLQGESKLQGIGFRKKARSKRAREERALAAEQRVKALQRGMSSTVLPVSLIAGSDSESEDERRDSETDCDRRRTLLEVIEEKDLHALKIMALENMQHFLLPTAGSSATCGDAYDNSTGIRSNAVSGGRATSQIRTALCDTTSTRPAKKQKTSQPRLDFTSRSIFAFSGTMKVEPDSPWDCMVCTLVNKSNHLACSACGTPGGNLRWTGDKRSAS